MEFAKKDKCMHFPSSRGVAAAGQTGCPLLGSLLKRLLLLPLVVAPFLVGCGGDVTRDSSVHLAGFASDTTAILFSGSWESTSSWCISHSCGGWTGLDLELQLVDVRFHKVYWRSNVKNNYGKHFWVEQWSDSTAFIHNEKGYLLWTIGNSKPQKIAPNWEVEVRPLADRHPDRNWFRWKNDSLVAGSVIVDTKTMTANIRDAVACGNWWGEVAGGGCLTIDQNSCSLSLLSEEGDTLSRLEYPHGCEYFSGFSVQRPFIKVWPIKNNHHHATWAMFRYDEEGNIAKEPSFWELGVNFVDSLGNVTRYY